MTRAEMEAYVRRAVSGAGRRYGISIDEAIAELRTAGLLTSADQEDNIRWAIMISNNGQ